MNVRSILIFRKRTVSLNEDNVNISCDLDRDDNSIDALMNVKGGDSDDTDDESALPLQGKCAREDGPKVANVLKDDF